jgi:hypothetical protein
MLAIVVATAAVGCSSTTSSSSGAEGASSSAPAATVPRPTGPPPTATAATIGGPLTGGNGIFLGASGPGPDLDKAGYTETEYTASGSATSYKADGGLPDDGTFQLTPDTKADYETRIVVRRPKDQANFNGTVAVEWLNVSGGVDAAPDYTYLADELIRKGYVWVGVSAQRIGVEGGPVLVSVPGGDALGAGKGLKALDPARYSSLHHPGDAYAYDIYTQVAQSLRAPGSVNPLAGLDVQHLLAVGESQSAFTLTTYYDGVQPLTHEFDGFFIHSRGGSPAPLSTANGYIDVAGSLTGQATKMRTDQTAPVMMIQTETDVLGLLNYYPARQPDNDHLRKWEVAGTSHADKVQIGSMESQLGCSVPINDGQQVFVLRAALRHLQDWVTNGTAPPHGDELAVDTSGAKPAYQMDAVGNVKGGVRTPAVDAPTTRLSGIAPSTESVICILFGSTTPLTTDQLHSLYSSKDDYTAKYTAATDAAIKAGFALPEDRDQILQDANASAIPS